MDLNDVTMHFLEGAGGPCAGLQFVEADTVEEAKANATLRRFVVAVGGEEREDDGKSFCWKFLFLFIYLSVYLFVY